MPKEAEQINDNDHFFYFSDIKGYQNFGVNSQTQRNLLKAFLNVFIESIGYCYFFPELI